MANETIEKVAEAVHSMMERLSDDARGCPQPEVEAVVELLGRITTSQGGRLRFLARPRKSDTVGAVFMERFRWHTGQGSGSLWGPMMSIGRVDHDTFELCDTVAACLAIYIGRFRSHSDRWAAALGMVR